MLLSVSERLRVCWCWAAEVLEVRGGMALGEERRLELMVRESAKVGEGA